MSISNQYYLPNNSIYRIPISRNRNMNITNSDDELVLKKWMSILTLLNTMIASFVSICIIIYVITIYISKRHSKKRFHVSLVLTCNTCLTIICSCVIFGIMTLSSLAGDFHYKSLQWLIRWCCHIRGYLNYVFLISIYLSYILQAAYRLFRIVYHKHKYLRIMMTFSHYIVIQWFLSFLLVLPMLFENTNYSSVIIYLPENFNCIIPFTNIGATTFSILSVYLLPLCGLCFIYIRILLHLKKTKRRPSITFKLRRQNKRDRNVIKRIYFVLIILWGLSFPSLIFYTIYVLTGHLHWTAYRLSCLAMSTSFVFISLSSLYVTPQIYKRIRVLCGQSKAYPKHSRLSYSISINIEREKKIESLLLEYTSLTDQNFSVLFQ